MKLAKELLVCMILVSGMSVVGCGSNGSNQESPGKEVATESKKETKQESNEYGVCMERINGNDSHEHQQGEKSSLSENHDVYYEILEVRKAVDYMGGEIKDAYTFDILMTNHTENDIPVSTAMCFEATDTESRKASLTITAEQNGSLDATLPANGKLRGDITFQASEGATIKDIMISLDLGENKSLQQITTTFE
ncbi:DUF4352 domain-containing protein [Romboutsia lituseburensis]|uniref:DUF4352 domain-containing protein n=1 Tax=Romboutsia lituseburensis TaxID=1537 RepID=UPI00215A2714|nr:hypothetical protein [Romboutsia lituseburensis]MCR8746217.1 hypothetical protein [Romboutsia lituseburensis]